MTWQPGFCGTDEGCAPDQPRAALIGLHGLWASLPQTLIARGVAPQEWWAHGCDYFVHSDAAPPLDPALERRLDDVMPHLAHSLLTHEYDKYVQCFEFDPTTFFMTELAMRDAVIASPFGTYLLARAGQNVAHADVASAFSTGFGTNAGNSLQLQCAKSATGRELLTQLWITVDAGKLSAFPQSTSFINAPVAQDNCPASFLLPVWPAA